jgi:hypothetical protein
MKIERFQASAMWAAMLSLAVVGCGGGAAREAQQLGRLNILEATRPLEQNRVKRNEIEKASDASGVRTLLQFWLTLQSGAYQSGTRYFDPRIANSVGVARLAAALRNEAPLWDSTKPRLLAATTKGATARVFFTIRELRGKVGGAEILFRKLGLDWKIRYLSFLSGV